MYQPGEISKFGDTTLPPWEWGVRQKGTFNKAAMLANIKDFKEVLDKESITFCLIFGTLLGAIREKDIIEGDSDFDVFCFSRDYRKWNNAKKLLRGKNFYIPDEVPFNDDYIIRDGEKIDINWVMPFGKFYVYNDSIYYPREYFDNLMSWNLWGQSFKIPVQHSQLLEDLYGTNWRTPSKSKGKLNIYPR